MTTLFDRLVNPTDAQSPTEQKISINLFVEALREIARGRLLTLEVEGDFQLSDSQKSDLVALVKLLMDADNPFDVIDVIRSVLVFGEMGVLPLVYLNEQSFWARIEDEAMI